MPYNPKISTAKGATEGGAAGIIAAMITGLVLKNNPGLAEDPQVGAAIGAAVVGVTTGVLGGLFKFFRNRRKHI